MPDHINLQLTVTLQEVLKIWSRQVGVFDPSVTSETREKKYTDALMSLFSMFANHHEEMDDSTFARVFRFFRDGGFTKRLNEQAPISIRYPKIGNAEPDMNSNKTGSELPRPQGAWLPNSTTAASTQHHPASGVL
jgi:hypothetical protein